MTNKEINIVNTAKGVLETLLTALEVIAYVETLSEPFTDENEAASTIAFDVKGEDLGILIGRQGQTLSSLQHIVRLIVAQQTKTWIPITVDVEGYRQRRNQTIQALAKRLAEQVATRRTPLTLQPMPAYERRIVHLTLADHPHVITQSVGTGEARQVVILPREK